jgi:YD repeat-containing protein
VVSTVDSFGRITKKADLATGAQVDTTYDAMNRVTSISNPYVNTGNGSTTYAYDVLSRKTLEVNPDETAQNPSRKIWTYLGNSVAYADEVGNSWGYVYDPLGQLIQANEPGSSATTYAYNALGNLTCIDQWGGGTPQSGTPCTNANSLKRMFSYDALSRITSATNPETGTVTYSYLNNGTPCAGAISLPCSKTDARNVTTSYTYDGLSRLISKTYTGQNAAATPSACYQYDTASNGVGRLGAEWTLFGSCTATSGYLTLRSVLAYDAVGRITQEQQCHRSSCTASGAPFNQTINYDLAGNLTSYGNGLSALTITNSYDTAGRLFKVSSSLTDATHPQSLYSISDFAPFGAPASSMLGGHISITQSYDSRLRSKGLSAVKQ